MSTLGRRTAELHAALAPSDLDAPQLDPAFAPEPIGPDEPAEWVRSLQEELEQTLHVVRERLGALSGEALASAGALLARTDPLAARLSAFGDPVDAVKSRLHGDFHLGQVLILGSDVVLIGFGAADGDLERRCKHSPLKDVAGLLFSIDCACAAALHKVTAERAGDMKVLEPLARSWETVARLAFMDGYRERIHGCPAWPWAPGEGDRLIALFTLQQACRTVCEAVETRPDWAAIPLGRLLELLSALD
jgi:maltose alpha-D-glucosyltransferase/alpha-amylase